MKAAELFVRCLENEGVEYVFGIPGEENIDIMDVLLDSPIQFIPTRHEQAAAFMADVYGRLTGRAGVCLATLGPGATNLVTGVADANMDRAPVVAISGQSATTRMHKESHQTLDLVNLLRRSRSSTRKWSARRRFPRSSARRSSRRRRRSPASAISTFPRTSPRMEVFGKQPLKVQRPMSPVPPPKKIRQAADIISNAKYPVIMAGNGVIRAGPRGTCFAWRESCTFPSPRRSWPRE